MFSKKILDAIRYYGSLIAITSVLLVFLTSIPWIGSLLWIHQFWLFLAASLLSILLIDIFVIDMLQLADSKIWRKFLFGLLAVFVLFFLGTIVFSYYQFSVHILSYLCYGCGIFLFVFYKQDYNSSNIAPNLWGLVSAGSPIIAILLSMCFASYIVSLGNIQQVNCNSLQNYSSRMLGLQGTHHNNWKSSWVSATSSWFNLSFEELLTKTPDRWQQFKKLYIDDVLSERKILSQNACEVIFAQISVKMKQHTQSIQISLLVLLFFLLWPFVIFFIWVETIIAYCILSGLVTLWCYHKEIEQKSREYRV
jgi:hypothetical protein